jgi:hypothetical protein
VIRNLSQFQGPMIQLSLIINPRKVDLRNKGDVTFAINLRKVWKFISIQRINPRSVKFHMIEPNYKLFKKINKKIQIAC